MEEITFSVVITVYNEAETIAPLIDSLLNQTLLPAEIIVVDGGSTDETVKIIKEKTKLTKVALRLFSKPGSNRSEGRNYGISKAQSGYVAVIDGGCEADREWLNELAVGFEEGAESVAGFYLPIINQPIQKLFAAYVAVNPRDLNTETFLPSSRSLAFTKNAWTKAGKYPERLNTCEDLVFAERLKDAGGMIVRPMALVYWRQADGIREFFRQIRGYAQGDVEAKYLPHLIKIATVWGRYIVFLLFPPLFLVYLLYPFWKQREIIRGVRDGFALPVVQLTADWGVMTGSVLGLRKLVTASG